MNQLVVTDTRAKLDLAKEFANAKMIPDHFKNSVGDCYIAISLADRHGMDPWTLMQELYIIKGKPMMSGKLATAILNHSLADPLRPEYSGEGDDREITLTGRPQGEEKPLDVKLKVRDAKTENEQWRKNPDQMLMYAGARMWGRRYTPDILLGILFVDEEITGTAPRAEPIPFKTVDAALTRSLGEKQKPEIIDPVTGEVIEHPVALPRNENEKPYDWGVRFVAAFRTSDSIDTVDQWLAINSDTLDQCKTEAPKVHGNLINAVNQFKLDLLQREEGPK